MRVSVACGVRNGRAVALFGCLLIILGCRKNGFHSVRLVIFSPSEVKIVRICVFFSVPRRDTKAYQNSMPFLCIFLMFEGGCGF